MAGFSVAAAPTAPRLKQRETIKLRIGIVPFDDPTAPKENAAHSEPSKDEFLRHYFDEVKSVTEADNHFPFVLDFVLVRGNYYQILQWTRDGLLDGAVVSAFSTYLLTHDPNLATFPVIEFDRNDMPAREGETPAFVLAKKDGVSLSDPNGHLAACFESILRSLSDSSKQQDCELLLVNHVSTTGFLYPLLRAAQFARRLTPDQQNGFWPRLIEWSHFTMWHNITDRKPGGLTRFSFSYEKNRDEPNQERLQLTGSPPTVNDVLLLSVKREWSRMPPVDNAHRRTAIATERAGAVIKGVIDLDRVDRDLWLTAATRVKPGPGYIGVSQWDEKKRKQVADIVEKSFGAWPYPSAEDKELPQPQHLFSDWYHHGAYAFTFTLDELVDLLINDQVLRNNRCAAVVLPGGGVRATYQAVMLDYLYGRQIENKLPLNRDGSINCNVGPEIGSGERRLQVAAIAGTSGGAVLGALVTHRRSGTGAPLEHVWIKDGLAKMNVADVFPPFSVFRWSSILLVLLVFGVIAAMYLPPSIPVPIQVPVWYTALLTVAIAFTPFVIWWVSLRDASYYPEWEGFALLIVLLVAHYFHSASLPGGTKSRRQLLAGLAVIVLSAAGCVSLILLYSRKHNGALWDVLSDPLQRYAKLGLWTVSLFPVVGVVLGLVIVAASRGIHRHPLLSRAYRWSGAALISLLLFALLLFICGRQAGAVTELEMTMEYWIWVFFAALIIGIVLIECLAMVPPSRDRSLFAGLRFFVTPSGSAPFPYSPAVTLIGWSLMSIAMYLIFIAPALYSGEVGRRTFERQLYKVEHPKNLSDPDVPRMSQIPIVPFIVSMTAFGGKFQGVRTEPGDYYAYWQHWQSSFHSTDHARVLPMDAQKFPKAIFASGSPFPIYPASEVPLEKTSGLFVDGGYAHRVPIDAALLAGVGQILIVENVAFRVAAPEDRESRLGPLVQNVPKAFSYLFDRSQTFDLQQEKSALVGGIYPDWAGDDPFLMDFRSVVIQRLSRVAHDDERGHRIGHIVSWGLPCSSTKRSIGGDCE